VPGPASGRGPALPDRSPRIPGSGRAALPGPRPDLPSPGPALPRRPSASGRSAPAPPPAGPAAPPPPGDAGAAAPAPPDPSLRPPPDYDPDVMSPAGWRYPVTFGTRFSRASVALIRAVTFGLCLLVLVVGVLWAVPSVVVARSAAYAKARERARADRDLQFYVGRPLQAEAVPRYYRLTEDGGEFRFVVRGPTSRVLVTVEVDGDQVSRPRYDWLSPWE